MSIIIPCMSWVPIVLKQIRELFVQNNNNNNNNNTVEGEVDENKGSVDLVDLPYEIIADILGRLPPKTALLCVGACKPLLDIMNPVNIAFHCQPIYCEVNNSKQVVNVCFTPHKSENYTTRSTRVHVCPSKCVPLLCVPSLYGSCNGLLLFRHSICQSSLFIWNPFTEEHITVIPTRTDCRLRGFFFHPKADEYRAVFLSVGSQSEGGIHYFDYYMYGLKTKTFRLITSYSYPPVGFRNPILLNGVLHWKVSDEIYKNIQGVYPDCSNSILLFDIYSETFSTMSHPGGQCRVRDRHGPMQLMKTEDHLYFCDPSSFRDIDIWKLQDYKNKVWIKIHVIREPHEVLFGTRYIHMLGRMPIPFDMHKDEVILCAVGVDLFIYNMSNCSFKRIGQQFTDLSEYIYPFYHVDSLVSLQI